MHVRLPYVGGVGPLVQRQVDVGLAQQEAPPPRRPASSAASRRPRARLTSFSAMPFGPWKPLSRPPWAGSMLTRRPGSDSSPTYPSIRSGMLTARPSSPTFCSRRILSTVVSPTMPSTLRPAFRWNSVTATSSSGEKMPSTGPQSKPSSSSLRCR